MAWVESVSPSFRARHHANDADDADRVLYRLERTRERLERVFPRIPTDVTVVLHGTPLGLAFAYPLLPAIWTIATPASRRYIAGWVGAHELHVLSPRALQARASNVEGSREMLAHTPDALYAKRVIAENSPTLATARLPRRVDLELRWAWLLEGGARWFGGQTDHARPAIVRRLHEGSPPRFPPGVRDAPLLGQTVVDLLAHTRGERAAANCVCRFEPVTEAFRIRSYRKIEREWRTHLVRFAQADTAARARAA